MRALLSFAPTHRTQSLPFGAVILVAGTRHQALRLLYTARAAPTRD
jgi:hypothetical protein